MNSQKKLMVYVTLLLVALMLVACGGETATEEPVAEEPAAVEPAAEEPAAEEPAAEEPAAEEPAAEEPAAEEPAAEEPAAEEPAAEEPAMADISGTITVLTNRTDIVDTTFVEYAAKFNEIYPNITVEFEAMTDYEGEVKIRMNTADYGDVLLIPNIPPNELPNFFEPLGTVEELGAKYNFVTERAFEGTTYGIPVTGNVNGVVYNKAVFAAAGVTELPTTPEAFLEAMRLVKENTDAIPVYTNYAAGWPLPAWEGNRGGMSCNPNFNNELIDVDEPFTEGRDQYIIHKLMYDLVAEGLTEEDPTTTDWELSKQLLGNGEVSAMVLGSWAIVQMEGAAANPADIGYMPFPYNVDGKLCTAASGDYSIAVNKNSENKEAAMAWLWWFLNESNFAFDQGGIPPLLGSEYPVQLEAFQQMNVELVSQVPAPAGKEGLVDAIDNEAEIGLWQPIFRQRIVDAARGATEETIEEIFADLNARWAEARAAVIGQ